LLRNINRGILSLVFDADHEVGNENEEKEKRMEGKGQEFAKIHKLLLQLDDAHLTIYYGIVPSILNWDYEGVLSTDFD
jgi:hypothetical protein